MQRLIFVAVAFCALSFAGQTEAQVLTLTGPCPGVKTIQVTGATPVVRVYFIHAANIGAWVVPPGQLCSGTFTGLAAPVTVAGFLPSDAFGNITTTATIPPAVCGNRYLQVVDGATCTTSNVVLIN